MINPEDMYLFLEPIVRNHLKDMKNKGALSEEYLKKFEEMGFGLDDQTGVLQRVKK